jgi:type I restriction enzyme S subunit
VFEVRGDVDRGYLDHVISSDGFARLLSTVASGVGARQKRVSPTNFLLLEIPLPDRPEQRRVADYLDGLAAINPTAQRATELASSVLPAGRNDLREQMGGVSRHSLGDLLNVRRTAVELASGKPYRRIGIYSWGKGFLHREPAAGSELGSMRYFTFPLGALMLSKIQAWEGAVAVTSADELNHVSSNRFLPYVPRGDRSIHVPFVAHLLLSDWGLNELRKASPGTQVRNRTLGQKLFEAIEIPVPPIEEQVLLSERLDGLAVIAGRARRAAELASAILPAARNEVFSSL